METRNQMPWLHGMYANVPNISDALAQNVWHISDAKPCLGSKSAEIKEITGKWSLSVLQSILKSTRSIRSLSNKLAIRKTKPPIVDALHFERSSHFNGSLLLSSLRGRKQGNQERTRRNLKRDMRKGSGTWGYFFASSHG